MRQFQVPQFITVEDRVLGPLTAKQALFLAGGLGLVILAHYLLVFILFIPVAAVVAGLSISLAFIRINEQPLWVVLRHGLFFFIRPRLFVWKQQRDKREEKKAAASPKETTVRVTPKLSESKLSDLAWSLNIKEGVRKEEGQNGIS